MSSGDTDVTLSSVSVSLERSPSEELSSEMQRGIGNPCFIASAASGAGSGSGVLRVSGGRRRRAPVFAAVPTARPLWGSLHSVVAVRFLVYQTYEHKTQRCTNVFNALH